MNGDLPLGGTTGLDHESSASVDEAARWIASTPWERRPHPIVPALQNQFGLTVSQACQALREASLIRGRAI